MSKVRKCKCNEILREETVDFMLTNHHPKCPQFNPASELFDMEQQCKHFYGIIQELRGKIREMQQLIDKIEE